MGDINTFHSFRGGLILHSCRGRKEKEAIFTARRIGKQGQAVISDVLAFALSVLLSGPLSLCNLGHVSCLQTSLFSFVHVPATRLRTRGKQGSQQEPSWGEMVRLHFSLSRINPSATPRIMLANTGRAWSAGRSACPVLSSVVPGGFAFQLGGQAQGP